MIRNSLKSLLGVCGIVAAAVWMVGCGGGAGGGSSDGSAPSIGNAVVSLPGGFSSAGGAVTFTAQVSDADGVSIVRARVVKPDGTTEASPIAMTLLSGTTYKGAYLVVANTTSQAKRYTVTVEAFDTANNRATSNAFTFDVPGTGSVTDTTPPTISNTQAVIPAGFDFSGGEVTIQADVDDAGGVKTVKATIIKPSGLTELGPVVMTLKTGKTYSGTYDAPANNRTDGQSETYTVEVVATDTTGNSKTGTRFTFAVPGGPPPPPMGG